MWLSQNCRTVSQSSEYKKQAAQDLYMTGLSAAEVADQVEVSKRTVERWVTAGDWKQRREAATSAKVTDINSAKHHDYPRRRRRITGPIDELEVIDTAISDLSAAMADPGDTRGIGSMASGLCRLLELRRKLNPPTAGELAEQVIALGISPAEFVRELKEQWQKSA